MEGYCPVGWRPVSRRRRGSAQRVMRSFVPLTTIKADTPSPLAGALGRVWRTTSLWTTQPLSRSSGRFRRTWPPATCGGTDASDLVVVFSGCYFLRFLFLRGFLLFNLLTGTGLSACTPPEFLHRLNPTNLPPRSSCCNLPAVVFSTAITKSLILPKITTAWSYNCYLFLHTLFMVPFWYFY